MIEALILILVGAWLGHKVATYLHIKAMMMLLTELKVSNKDLLRVAAENGLEVSKEATEESEMDEYEIVVEKHGDELYAFKVDGEFLGQGKDRDSLVARIAERYSNVRFTVKEGKEYLKPDEA